MRIDVAATLTMTSPEPATALLQVAVADPATEQLTVLSGGRPVEPEEFEVDGARVHRLNLGAGDTTVTYSASAEDGGPPRKVTPAEWAAALRPSRYCPSDQLEGFATTEFDRASPRPSWSRAWPTGCTVAWSTRRERAARSTPPSTRCSPARASAVTTRT